MLHRFLIVLLFLLFTFSTVACGSSSVTYSQIDTYAQVTNSSNYNTLYNSVRSKTMEKSNYESVRIVFSASEFLEDIVDRYSIVSSTPLGVFAKIAAKVVKGGIYIEDWLHTDKKIERRITEILSSPKLLNATEYPNSYSRFEKYIKTTLKRWVPDRDYPKIGYLPEELLYNPSLGEKEITKYWPEATKEEQAKYVALTFDELVLNYELVWNDLHQNKKIPQP